MKTNLVGRRFGRLIAVSCAESIKGATRWNCVCDCGNNHTVYYTHLLSGTTKSCGKCPIVDLIGHRFHSLLVIDRVISKKNRSRWLCRCDCGKTTIATGTSLRNGHKKSCGCRYQLSFTHKDGTLCRSLWGTYKSLAKKRGYDFSLDFETFQSLTKQNCFYCGKEPSQVLKPREYGTQEPYIYNGVDRVDNTKGYNVNNTVPCCGMCNSFKSNYSKEQFIEHCNNIYNFQNSKRQTEMICPVSNNV